MSDDNNKLSREAASALVDLLRVIRPAWDARAALTALGEVRDKGDVAFVAYRSLKAALDPAASTPRAITFDQYWTEPDALRTLTHQPPRMSPEEFRPRNPAPPEAAVAHIARIRETLHTHPQEDDQ